MEAVELSQQQSLRIAELPEDYLVVGVHGRAPLVREPTGQVLRIQPDGRLTEAKIAVERRHADRSAGEAGSLAAGVRPAMPYTMVFG
jgi:hypothetical protein